MAGARISLPGIRRASASFEISFDGRSVTAFPGESLAAALHCAGELGLRATAQGDRRGIYCGMGVCGECSVVVDGEPRRACMTMAAPGQAVTAARPRATPHLLLPDPSLEPGQGAALRPDLLVVGAGPAGLSAARAAAAAGLSVLVVDERAKAGGQYFKQPGAGFTVERGSLDPQFAEGLALIEQVGSARIRVMAETTVWAAQRDAATGAISVDLATGQRRRIVHPRRLVIATGSYERPWPVPGWTLPGVMTTGAAQTLLRAYQTAPGKRVLIVGNGPLNLQLASELSRAGVRVVALAEQSPAPGLGSIGDAASLAMAAPGLVRDGLVQLAGLRRAGVQMLYRHVLVRAEGDGQVEHAIVARVGRDGHLVPGSERRFAVDAVCIGAGFLPQAEMARALGCRFTKDASGGPVAVRDDDGRSSIETIFIAGDGGGMGGARIAMAQGTLAGLAAARDLDAPSTAQAEGASLSARRMLARHRRFQAALWRLYAPVELAVSLTTDATLVCRCEAVAAGTIAGLVADGTTDIGAVKRACRAGMGRCQGRYCAPQIAAVIERAGGRAANDPGFAPRSPFKPLAIGTIAAARVPTPPAIERTDVRSMNISIDPGRLD